jgi:hypothetical protein
MESETARMDSRPKSGRGTRAEAGRERVATFRPMAELREPLVAVGLGAFVRGRSPLIVAVWGARARTLAAARDLDEPTLVDDIPDILERIAADLDGVEPPNPAALEDLAAQHANVRLASGYDVRGAAWELATLRDVILELWEGGGGGPIKVRELRLLNRRAC